jgi:hypothetical protein
MNMLAGSLLPTDDLTLTRQDCRRIRDIRQHWVDIAWSTERCEWDSAVAAIEKLYRLARLPQPVVIPCPSPQHMATVLDALAAFDDGGEDHLLGSLEAVEQLRVLRGSIEPIPGRKSVLPQLWSDPWSTVGGAPVSSEVRWQIFDALVASQAPRGAATFGEQFWRRCSSVAHWSGETPVLSAMESEQIILWDVFLEVLGVDDPVIRATVDVLQQVSFFAPMEGLVLVADRPIVVRETRADRSTRRLHGDKKPAVGWDDGTGLNYWNGYALPEGFWQWTPEQVVSCHNLELRSIAIRSMGWEAIVGALSPIAVAEDPGHPGHVIELFSFAVASANPLTESVRQQFVRVTNASPDMDGTHRTYILQVHPYVTDPVTAVAESFGVSTEAYRNLARAC